MDEILGSRLKDLVRTRNAFARWFAKCDAYSAGLTTELKGQPPSKARKHHMYSDAYAVARMLDIDVTNGIRDLAGIDAIIAAAQARP